MINYERDRDCRVVAIDAADDKTLNAFLMRTPLAAKINIHIIKVFSPVSCIYRA